MIEISYTTVGHTSRHHAMLGPWYQSGPLLCDKSKKAGRVIKNPDPAAFCGECIKVLLTLDLWVWPPE